LRYFATVCDFVEYVKLVVCRKPVAVHIQSPRDADIIEASTSAVHYTPGSYTHRPLFHLCNVHVDGNRVSESVCVRTMKPKRLKLKSPNLAQG